MTDQPRYNNGNGEEESSLHLRDLFGIFLRRRRLFIYLAVPVFLGIMLYRVTRPYYPAYLATFDLGVAREKPVEGMFNKYSETPVTQIGTNTQRVISTLLSVNFTGKIVDTLSLCANIKNGGKAADDFDVRTRIKSNFQSQLGPYKLSLTRDGYSLQQNGNTVVPLTPYGSGHETDLGNGALAISVVAQGNIERDRTYTIVFYPRDRMALALRNSTSINVLEADRIDKGIDLGEIPGSGEKVTKKLVTANDLFPGVNLVGILRINIYWGNPQEALRIAQALSSQIIREDISEKSQAFIQSRIFIESQLAQYQDKLTILEDNIKVFKETKKIANLQASTQALINQISTLESRKNQIEVEEQIIKSLNEYLTASAGDTGTDTMPNFAATLLSSPALQNLYNQFFQAEAELKGKLKEYSNEHPKILEIRAKIDGIKSQMKEEVARRMSTIGTEIASVDRQIRILQGKLENVPVDEINLARLERDRETAEKLYTYFAEKLEETRVLEASVTSDLKIINPPVVTAYAVNSRGRLMALLLAFVISIIAGGVGIFIAEYFDNTIKNPSQIREKTGLPIFAAIPVIEDPRRERNDPAKKTLLLRGGRIAKLALNGLGFTGRRRRIRIKESGVITDTGSVEFEAFRKLSVHLDFAHPERRFQVIYVVSPGPEEGKTFVALNLSVALSYAGKKVIVIDTDFRKKSGHLSDVTRAKKERGLFDILQGKSTLKEAIVTYKPESEGKTKDEAYPQVPPSPQSASDVHPRTPKSPSVSLSLLPVGAVPPNPFVFLESEKMRGFLAELKKEFDYVIIDGLPVLLFSDATYLASFADGMLITVMYGKTNIRDIENAYDSLKAAKTTVLGVVLNNVPRTADSYYYQYYYKYYSKYYRKEAKT